MSQDHFADILASLETFILLKQQNHVIFSWMELKKRNRIMQASRIRSCYERSVSSKKGSDQFAFRLHQPNYLLHNNSTPKIPRKESRIVTQNYIDGKQVDLYGTFNKNPQVNRYTLTEKSIYKNQLSRAIFPTQNEQAEDSDQFEDIVLDRLSKLEENINQLMRERKSKEQKRGNIGSTVNQSKPKNSFINDENFHKDGLTRQNKKFTNLHERKKNFFQSLQSHYETPKQVNYNLKYIPVSRKEQEPKISIQRIRKLIERNDEQHLIDNVEYFNEANLRKEGYYGQSRKASTSLYMNRYGGATKMSDRIHYSPHHIEMQTTIEPKRRIMRYSFKTDKSFEVKPNDDLNLSKLSHSSSKKNNLSSYY